LREDSTPVHRAGAEPKSMENEGRSGAGSVSVRRGGGAESLRRSPALAFDNCRSTCPGGQQPPQPRSGVAGSPGFLHRTSPQVAPGWRHLFDGPFRWLLLYWSIVWGGGCHFAIRWYGSYGRRNHPGIVTATALPAAPPIVWCHASGPGVSCVRIIRDSLLRVAPGTTGLRCRDDFDPQRGYGHASGRNRPCALPGMPGAALATGLTNDPDAARGHEKQRCGHNPGSCAGIITGSPMVQTKARLSPLVSTHHGATENTEENISGRRLGDAPPRPSGKA
jgi:hypothetical protein